MVSLLLTSPLFALVLIATTFVDAAPSPHHSLYHPTHRRHVVGKRATKLTSYNPKSTFETFGAGVEHSLSKRAGVTLKEAAFAFAHEKLGCNETSLSWRSGYSHSTAEVAYFRQSYDGIEFANSVVNVAFKNNKAVAFGSSFFTPTKVASKEPTISVESAIKTAESQLEANLFSEVEPKLEYLAKEDGSAVLTHVLQVQDESTFNFYEAYVNAHTGEVESVVDFTADATFRAIPIQNPDPTVGIEDIVDPEDTFSSPNGWVDGSETSGNNAISFVGNVRATSTETSPGEFLFDFNPRVDPTQSTNVDFARTNAFYIVNSLHDIFYRYGFTEDAFNFQQNNGNKGGRGNDRVRISVQDAAGLNNAQFATPPDGQSGQMRMFIFDQTNPRRDGSLSNDIVAHEMTHGLTNRLTGGGTGRCLQTLEAGGLGEGWSDSMAMWSEQTSAQIGDVTTGGFALGNDGGVRQFPQSTSARVNPLRYSDVAQLQEVHQIGEVWANMLFQVYAGLVEANGFSAQAFTKVDGTEGNVVFAHNFIDGLALQPCNPTFVTARNAFIQADINRYDGANECLIWQAFASRGLGLNADNFEDDDTVPAKCQSGGNTGSTGGSTPQPTGENGGGRRTRTATVTVTPKGEETGTTTTTATVTVNSAPRRGCWFFC